MRSIILLTAMAMASYGCAHSQRPDSRIYVVSEEAAGVGAALAIGGAGDDICQKELEKCMHVCWEKHQWPYPHNRQQSGWYYKRCTTDCNQAFKVCEEEHEQSESARGKKIEFSRMKEALAWLRAHKTEVALGTVVVVAGVAFVLTTGGSGALILAPLAL